MTSPKEPLIMVFTPEGTVEFTRSPKLYEFFEGDGDMERVSEIHKSGPRYYIRWLMGPFAGQDHTFRMAKRYRLSERVAVDMAMLFSTYEAAVEHEVKMLNAMRREGVTFGTQTTEQST